MNYAVQCVDSGYDSEKECCVLKLLLLEQQEYRVITWPKNDLLDYYNFVGDRSAVSADDMRSTAKLLKGLKFNWVLQDDPNRVEIKNEEEYAQMFRNKISDELEKVADGLANEDGQIARKISRLNRDGKINFVKLIQEDENFRKQYGDPPT